MMANIYDKILQEFRKSNFKKSYDLALSLNNEDLNENILKILTISSFNLQKYSDSIKYGLILFETYNVTDDLQLLNILGTSYSIINDYKNGNYFFHKYLLIEKKNYSVIYNYGINHFRQENYTKSKEQFEKIISEKKEYKESELIYGIINSELKDYKKAKKIFKDLIKRNKNLEEAFYNLGICYQKTNNLNLSIEFFEKAIIQNNKNYQFFNSIGVSYQKIFNSDKAEIAFKKAISLNAQSDKAYYNLGLLKHKSGFFEKAINYYDQALKLKPNDTDILFNKSLCLLENGNFNEGINLYKWRLGGIYKDNSSIKLEDIKGKNVLITCDQGLGDTILFSRFLKLLLDLKTDITLCVMEAMVDLMKCVDPRIQIISATDNVMKYDYNFSLGDFVNIFKLQERNIPKYKNYININKKYIDKWSRKIDKQKFNIGVIWQGRKNTIIDEGRSIELNYFKNISKIQNVQLISLQKNEGIEQISDFQKKNSIMNFDSELDVNVKFLDTAGLMKNLDLVICSDTSIPHLAGSLGVKVWLLVQKYPYWYWSGKNNQSMWYDSIKIYRQSKLNSWSSVFNKIEKDLKNQLANQ
tara:strand:- start:455 stop:2203 length:1749 start_codon:yes stop_codon:yes gene_type:complete